MDRVETHIHTLLKTYNLEKKYNQYILFSILTTSIKESFYWLLLVLNVKLQSSPHLLNTFIGCIIMLYSLNIPAQYYLNKLRCDLLDSLVHSNIDYFKKRLYCMQKRELLNFNINQYFDVLLSTKLDFENYLLTKKYKYDIPVKFMTLGVVAYNYNCPIIFILMPIFFILSQTIHHKNNAENTVLVKEIHKDESDIKKYMVNSKLFLINGEVNEEYLTKKFKELNKHTRHIQNTDRKIDTRIDILIFIIIVFIIYSKLNKINVYEFLIYFYIIYDIEFIYDTIHQYYSGYKRFNDFGAKLDILYSFECPTGYSSKETLESVPRTLEKRQITSIQINKIICDKLLLQLNTPITIRQNDHILVDGVSGSGKSTLLYILKGIQPTKELDITPTLSVLSVNSFINLPNHKSIYSGNLYDIISNYSSAPDEMLIKECVGYFKLDKLFPNGIENRTINIEEMSAGEQIRLLLSRSVYNIKKEKYSVLLFDEVDENLNETLSVEICNTLRTIFSNKIIFYITHNDNVKRLFNKKLMVEEGIITSYNI